MIRSKLCFEGIRYKWRERDLIFIGIGFVVCGLLGYYRAVSSGYALKRLTFFELYIWNMGNPVNLVFIQTSLFCLTASKYMIFGEEDLHFILHKKSKSELCAVNVCSMLWSTVACAAGFGISVLLMSLNRGMFHTGNQSFLQNSFGEGLTHDTADAAGIFAGLFFNTVAYFLCLSFILCICACCTGKRSRAILCTFTLVILDYILYLCKVESIEKYSFLAHTLPVYNEKSNLAFQGWYWTGAGGLLCLLLFVITGKTDIVKTKRRLPGWMHAVKNVICFQFWRKFLFFSLIGIVYDCLACPHIGYSERGFAETLALFFAGSDRLDVRFLMWVFLELAVTLYITNFVYRNHRYYAHIRVLQLKSKENYIKFLAGRMAAGTVLLTLLLICCAGIFVWMARGSLEAGRFALYSSEECGFYLLNYMLSLLIFSLLVCVFHLYIRNFSQSYLLALVLQLINLTLYHLFGGIVKYMPFIHGCFYLYSPGFTWEFALIYQAAELTLLMAVYWNKMKKVSVLL